MNANNVQASNPSHQVPIPGLPFEIGLEILRYLPCTIVNKCLTLDKQTWASRFQVQWILFLQKEALTSSELKQYQRLFSLEADPSQRIIKSWETIAGDQTFHNVKSLCIDVPVSTEEMVSIIMRCPNLTTLDLKWRKAPPGLIEELSELGKVCPHLKHINLEECENLTDRVVIALVKSCPELVSINVNGCSHLTEEANIALAFFAITQKEHLVAYHLKKYQSWMSSNIAPGMGIKSYDQLARDPRLNLSNLKALSFGKAMDGLSSEEKSEIYYGEVDLAFSTAELLTIISLCPNLTTLDLSGCSEENVNALLPTLSRYCPKLTSIKLTANPSNQEIINFAKSYPDLKSIDLADCCHVTDEVLIALAENCPKLTSINLENCSLITDRGVAALARLPLSSINLSIQSEEGSERVGNASILALRRVSRDLVSLKLSGRTAIGNDELAPFAKNCSKLTYLNLCKLDVEDATIVEFAKHSPRLFEVFLVHCNKITDISVLAFAVHCPGLDTLRTDGCYHLSKEALRYYTQLKCDAEDTKIGDNTWAGLPSMNDQMQGLKTRISRQEKLSGSGLYDFYRWFSNSYGGKSWEWYIKKYNLSFPNLKTLDLSEHSGNLSEFDIIAILKVCPNLTSIHLGNCDDHLANSALVALGSYCPKLTSLNVTGDNQYRLAISNDALELVAMNCPNLTSLKLKGGISNDALKAFFVHSKNLSAISLTSTWSISDAPFSELSRNGAKLTSIHLGGCSGMSDQAFLTIGKECPNLTSLTLPATKITDVGLLEIGKGCKKMTSVDLSNCHEITASGVEELAKGSTQLSKIFLYKCKQIKHYSEVEAIRKVRPYKIEIGTQIQYGD